MLFDVYLIIPAIAVIITFLYNAIQDYKHMRVRFYNWIPMVVVSIPFVTIWYYHMFINLHDIFFMIFAIIILICGIFYLLGKFGLIGGADSIGFICLCVCMPSFPFTPITGVSSYGIFPVAVLINSLIIGVVMIPILITTTDDVPDNTSRSVIPFIVPVFCAILVTFLFGDIISMVTTVLNEISF